jgi:hypothetical protein
LQAGCFVLISNLDSAKDLENFSAQELLRLHKDQDGIERNFSFLKDPVIVNSIFLKKNHRIEVLGLVLLISLLIWRLMEHCMCRHSLVMIRYLLLVYIFSKRRLTGPVGPLFRQLSDDQSMLMMAQSLWAYVKELIIRSSNHEPGASN